MSTLRRTRPLFRSAQCKSVSSRLVHTDCRYFLGSRPCSWHKLDQSVCESCTHFEPVEERIGIVKLGAMGDVLRTTALLADIVSRHSAPRVTWFTLPESREVLIGNALVDEVITTFDFSLGAREFDVVYSLDNASEGVALATALNSRELRGFRCDPFGRCDGAMNANDDTLFEIGLWDDLKRQNTKPYLQLLASIAGVSYSGGRPIIELSVGEVQQGARMLAGLGPPIVGINVDAGIRWLRKQWNLEYVEAAAHDFAARGFGVVLFGGKSVESWNDALAGRVGARCRSLHTSQSVRDLFAALSAIDVLLTGDTLAMHAAWALGKPVVALFGPTSLAEITLGTHDIKLATDELACLGCYLHTCTVSPHCMDRLAPAGVVESVLHRLSLATAKVPSQR